MLRILIYDVFLECSRYNKHKSNMSNKRINDPSLFVVEINKQKRKEELLPLCRCQAAKNRVSVLREARGNGRTFVRASI
jgi:hypothetical protein